MTATQEQELPKAEVEFLEYLDTEIAELEERESRLTHLKSIRAAMTGQAPKANSRSPRGPRNQNRLGEFVGIVAANPGITIKDAADRMGAAPNYLYRLKTKAVAANQIRTDGSNLFPVEGAAAA